MNNMEKQQHQEINIMDFLSHLLKYKYLIISLTFSLSLILIVVLLAIPNKFESKSTFYVSDDPGSTSSSMKLLSGLSSLGGISNFSLPATDVAEHDITMSKIKSRDFLEIITSNEDLKANIYAAKDFNFENNSIIYDESLYNSSKGHFYNKNGKIISSPDIDDIHKKYLKMVSISRNKTSGIIDLSFVHFSPYFAAEIIDLILINLDKDARKTAINELNKSIAYFESKLLITKEAELKSSLNSLMKTKLEQLMLANVKENYLINIISRPFVPKYKSAPKKSLIGAVGFLLSLFISILISFIYHFSIKND